MPAIRGSVHAVLLTGNRARANKLDQRRALGVRSSLSESSGSNHGFGVYGFVRRVGWLLGFGEAG
jgi:hypothetical protein